MNSYVYIHFNRMRWEVLSLSCLCWTLAVPHKRCFTQQLTDVYQHCVSWARHPVARMLTAAFDGGASRGAG